MKVNIPGRVVEFSMDGEAYLAFRRGEDPVSSRELDNDEYELFRAIEEGRRVRPRMGGYYVIADLTEGGVRAARYWAETLQTAAHGDASWDSDMRMDLRAARRLLAKLPDA